MAGNSASNLVAPKFDEGGSAAARPVSFTAARPVLFTVVSAGRRFSVSRSVGALSSITAGENNGVTRRQRVFGQRAGIYFLAREVIWEGKLIVRPATMNTPSPW